MSGTSREEGALMHVWARTRTALSIATAAMLLAACTTQFGGGGTTPPAGRAAANGAGGRWPGSCRSGPAAVRARQCRRRGAVDEERRRDGAGGIQESEYPAAGERRRRHAARRAIGRPAGDQRRRGNHRRPAVRAVGQRGRSGRARAQYSGDCVLDRCERGCTWRLPAEFPARDRRTADRRFCRFARQAIVRRAAARQCLRHRRGGGLPAGSVASRRSCGGCWKNIRSTRTEWRRPPVASAQAANQVDSIFIPDGADAVPQVVQALAASGVNLKRVQLLGTGLWDDPRIFSTAALDGGWYAAPESTGFRNFSARYRARYGQDPVRTATLAYDAVALVAALVKTQGPQRFSEQVLTNASGFAGIDGVFRFRPEGPNERGLAVLRVTPSGGQVISPAPHSFAPGT